MNPEIIYQLALSQIPGIGPILAKNLLSYCGSPEAIFREKFSLLSKIPGIGTYSAAQVVKFKDFQKMEKEVDFMNKNRIQSIFITQPEYPYRLRANIDGPLMLFKRGKHGLDTKRMVGIIGTRSNTNYGRDIANQLISDLMNFDVTIVSGMAYGIDVISHQKCVELNIPTIGVLAHSLDRIYPSNHHHLAEKMVDTNGALVTEFMSGTKPDRENFPKRNRIVAGLIDVLVVVQTAKKGGSMITADLAFQYDREVMAFPGRVGDEVSKGCHFLIKTNKAHMIESAVDLIQLMNYDVDTKKPEPQKKLLLDLSDAEIGIINQLKLNGALSIDVLSKTSGLNAGKLAQILLQLEIQDLVRTLPGKHYELK